MEIVKKTEAYQIIKKRNGRYAVRGADRKWIGGDEKVNILVDEGLVKAAAPKKEEPEEAVAAEGEPEAQEEAPAEEASAEAGEEEETAS